MKRDEGCWRQVKGDEGRWNRWKAAKDNDALWRQINWSAVMMAGRSNFYCSAKFTIFSIVFSLPLMKDVLYQIDNPPKVPVIKFQTILSQNGNPLALFWQPASGARVRHLGFRAPRRRAYFSSRFKYYPNTVASLRLTRLTIARDICPNPGPPVGGCKTKCHSWSKVIIRNQRVVDCSSCRMRYHIKCGGLSVKNFKKMRLVGNQTWICHKFIFNVLPSHVCSP